MIDRCRLHACLWCHDVSHKFGTRSRAFICTECKDSCINWYVDVINTLCHFYTTKSLIFKLKKKKQIGLAWYIYIVIQLCESSHSWFNFVKNNLTIEFIIRRYCISLLHIWVRLHLKLWQIDSLHYIRCNKEPTREIKYCKTILIFCQNIQHLRNECTRKILKKKKNYENFNPVNCIPKCSWNISFELSTFRTLSIS